MITTLIVRIALITLLAALAPVDAKARMDVFPTMTTNDLNGRTATFPRDLPGKSTLVLIAYEREQQKQLDVWIEKLGLKKADAPAWIEIPVIENYGSLWRGAVDSGMRSGIVKEADRARVFTVYGSRATFRTNLKLPSNGDISLLWVDRDGTIRHRVDGSFTEQKASELRQAISAGR
jgi:hypothetical protein